MHQKVFGLPKPIRLSHCSFLSSRYSSVFVFTARTAQWIFPLILLSLDDSTASSYF